jgi:glyoxylase-like metal-dependent hydrolase (beta-lactamase superfamily II)
VTDAERHEWIRPGAFEVAPGVFRIPLPIPNDALRAVNVYAIVDGNQATLIDSGWAFAGSEDHLVAGLGAIGLGLGNVTEFLVTHMHPDHLSQAFAIRKRLGIPVSLGLRERPSLSRMTAGGSSMLGDPFTDLPRHGAAELADRVQTAEHLMGRDGQWELPDRWLPGWLDLHVGDRLLRVIPTPGHTQGHLSFYDPNAGLFFAGDHILPHITPSIGFEPSQTRTALADYLDSLRLVRCLPDAVLLPAHGPSARSVHNRADELLSHHADRLSAALDIVASGVPTSYGVAQILRWTRHGVSFSELDVDNQVLAVTETRAHLDLLVDEGLLNRSQVGGVEHFQLATAGRR